MERWRDGEMERWRDGEMERWREKNGGSTIRAADFYPITRFYIR
jgi:hypothetical protein